MGRTVGIGIQDFEEVRTRNVFYIDKTDFIKEWWESNDDVTLIARPRRFGKTLNMSMLEKFFVDMEDNEAALMAKGIGRERIRKYGFAFCGKEVLIDGGKFEKIGEMSI